MGKLIYPELSYKIVGCAFEVFKGLGSGHKEKYYQKALEKEYIHHKIEYKKEVPFKLNYKKERIGICYLDFLVEDKIVVEIKVGKYFKKQAIDQILSYLKMTDLKLGIIINFSRGGAKFFRVLNAN